jgi:hypothetical protein
MLHTNANTHEDHMERTVLRSVRSRQTYAAMAGTHGPRLATYATQINPLDIPMVLGHDPRSEKRRFLNDQKLVELYDFMQRKTSSARREAIKAYVEDRLFPKSDLVGGFPAISIAVQFPVASEEINSTFPGVVNMHIDTGVHNKRVALDGLGRISGVLALVDEALSGDLSDADAAELQEALAQISLPCVFYSPRPGQPPLTQEEMGQLFHDFNFKVTPVSAKDAIALDQSDPYIRATYTLAREAEYISKYGMDTKSASLGSKSRAIVVQPVLLRFIRAALEGSRYVEAARNVAIENPHLNTKNASQVLGALADFIDTFAAEMGAQWDNRESVHLSSSGWQALGVIYHDVAFRLKNVDRQAFARALANKIDWRRDAPIWESIMTLKQDKDGSVSLTLLGAGASTRRQIVKSIRDEMGLTELLEGIKDENE